jgi:hypothetical protein
VKQRWYNTTFHSALQKSPFEVLYGYKPKHFGLQDGTSTTMPDLAQWLKDKEDMTKLIQQHLLRAQQRMKSQADKKRVKRFFNVGDKVYLKLQPYVQTSVARRSNQKLSYKYFGPFTILQRVGAVAYKLELPPGSLIHPVVHVSLLKPALPANTTVEQDLPLQCLSLTNHIVPIAVLNSKQLQAGTTPVTLVLVQWSYLPSSWVTWENKNQLLKDYPNAPAWGQAGKQHEGTVTYLDQPLTSGDQTEAHHV